MPNGCQLENVAIQSAAPCRCSYSTISPFKKQKNLELKKISVYVIIEVQGKLLDINLWEGNIFKIPSCHMDQNQEDLQNPEM